MNARSLYMRHIMIVAIYFAAAHSYTAVHCYLLNKTAHSLSLRIFHFCTTIKTTEVLVQAGRPVMLYASWLYCAGVISTRNFV